MLYELKGFVSPENHPDGLDGYSYIYRDMDNEGAVINVIISRRAITSVSRGEIDKFIESSKVIMSEQLNQFLSNSRHPSNASILEGIKRAKSQGQEVKIILEAEDYNPFMLALEFRSFQIC